MNDSRYTENLTIHHKVKDYASWRKGYDDHEKARHATGITNGRVFRSAEDPDDLILQDVADVAQARAWLGGDELKASMTKAGVIGSPNVRFVAISRLAGRHKPGFYLRPPSVQVGSFAARIPVARMDWRLGSFRF